VAACCRKCYENKRNVSIFFERFVLGTCFQVDQMVKILPKTPNMVFGSQVT